MGGPRPHPLLKPRLDPRPHERLQGPDTPELLVLREGFAELGRIVLDQQPLVQVLRQVADLAVACVPGAEEVSVTVVEDGKVRTAASTGPVSAALDARQYQDGAGPCLDAAHTGDTVHVHDASVDGEHPGFGELARRHGVRSSLSVGVAVPRRIVGAVNMYCTGGPGFDEHAVELAQGFAGYAAVALANAALCAETARVVEQMRQAMASRAVVEQAKGILMARTGLSATEAFTQLSTVSQNSNRKVRVIAAEIVDQAARTT